jgi:hypothetical protein
VHHVHNVAQSTGRVGEFCDRVTGGDIDGRGGGSKSGRLQGSRGGSGDLLVRSASKIVLPTPIRRAIVWPMEPAPMTTTSSAVVGVLIRICLS